MYNLERIIQKVNDNILIILKYIIFKQMWKYDILVNMIPQNNVDNLVNNLSKSE